MSRIASRLEADSYVVRESTGSLRVKDSALLLDAWRDEYRFDRHTLIQGSGAARSGDSLTRFVGDALSAASVEHTATGLSAAWQLTHFAAFRIDTVILAEPPAQELRVQLGFREEPRCEPVARDSQRRRRFPRRRASRERALRSFCAGPSGLEGPPRARRRCTAARACTAACRLAE